MHCSGTLPLTFEGPEQGFEGKNSQNGSWGNLVQHIVHYSVLYAILAFLSAIGFSGHLQRKENEGGNGAYLLDIETLCGAIVLTKIVL